MSAPAQPPAGGAADPRLDPAQLDNLAASFAVLGRLQLTAPDEQTLLSLWELLDEWPLTGAAATAAGLAELQAARRSGESSAAIRQDHSYLYGDTAVARVAPYESVHRGLEGLVFDEQTLEVRQAYRSLSLAAPRINQEPDDHLGLEFDFISQANLKALDALDAGSIQDAHRYSRAGADFLRDHLQQWAPEMLARVVDEAGTHFMRGLALLSLGALQSYAELIGEGWSE
ncbi:MAG: molecular chaperone TorD family protein [Propionicimonas sp.]